MGAPPIGLGTCDQCRYYDREPSWCRVLPPAAHAAAPGGWPPTVPTHWCGRWESPTALPMDIALSPGQAARMSGIVQVSVFAEGAGQFVAGDVVRFNAMDQPTALVSPGELRFGLETNLAAGNYPVRVYRASEVRLSHAVVFVIT